MLKVCPSSVKKNDSIYDMTQTQVKLFALCPCKKTYVGGETQRLTKDTYDVQVFG